ncbi:MAG: 6-hydroxynicotinate reductase, partial [Rhizobacter sp.]|nr:6-hydroxynicotinate reductase [Rhizobacter sp.]
MTDPAFIARSDGQPLDAAPEPVVLEHSRAPERMAADKVRCEACPVLCQISPGKLGACDRY